jgi:hypothetical protein
MSGGIEAAGDIATGAFIGRAVEPRAGESPSGASGHGLCLNCGTALIGDFCHACGQSEHVHRSLTSIGHDLLHGVFHFEGKIWRTMPMLLLHPGALTRRYIAGERARFVSPLALFLFSVFLMFATIHTISGDMDPDFSPAKRGHAATKLDAEIAKAAARLDIAKAAHARLPANMPDGDLIAAQETLDSLKSARRVIPSVGAADDFGFTNAKTGWAALDKGIAKANANPGLALYKLQSSAYKYSWALIPISVPFVAMLFLWHRRFKLYDHAIFVTYSLAFMMLLVVTLSLCLAVNAPGWIFATLLLIAPPVHMFAQLRGAYSLRKRSALWRTIALMTFAFVALGAFATLLLLLGLTE